ncbi:MAG: leucine--tRNA ligase [Deltaproteobacteria bacterium]|nr:leucine--tRNA ligase [Deltaproteobacteria bacterium]
MRYDPNSIEPKWQAAWDEAKAFKTPTDLATLKTRPKFYVLDMFPYPSGAGLHVGHPEGYTATDVVARLKRMLGFWVLHPMGWDAFGLPAERAAVREGIHPAVITKRNVDNFRRQIKRLGFSYDWDREVDTSSPDYYRHTQWIFLQLYHKGLAYLAEVPVNWCPALGTVLANEEVKDGKYVETGDPVERRTMKQWMLKIPVYAQRLIDDLDGLDWPEGVKEMQRNWIGRSEGAEIDFRVVLAHDVKHPSAQDTKFRVFTTRPDTLFGASYCVLAPEHPLVDVITAPSHKGAVDAYVSAAKQKTDLARTDLAKEKTGVFTGAYAINPATEQKIPIWVADYVLSTYGTGAIMAVPGHDERDHEFARAMKLPIVQVVRPAEGELAAPIGDAAFVDDGIACNSGFLDALTTAEAKKRMIDHVENVGWGSRRVQFKLRDWLFSRQRYWGEPFPIVHTDDGEIVALAEDQLPVTLPAVDEYKPTGDGKPPLGRASPDWGRVKLPDGRMATRELNTMPQWAGSCWYYLRYLDAHNTARAWDADLEKYWMPVDLYVGGVEHAVLHLLYARFWHKVLFDCGLVSSKEPFHKLFNQGMILAYSYQDAKGKYYGHDDVEEKDGKAYAKGSGEELKSQIEKMSKSKYNVVNPDDVIRDYGADALRLYELFMGPLEQVKPWQMAGVEGVSRFLARAWRLVVDEETGALSARVTAGHSAPDLEKALHKTLKKVREDTEAMRFNTAISQMMTFVNECTQAKELSRDLLKGFTLALSPYAPHLAEELWQRLGGQGLACQQAWPAHDERLCVDDSMTLGVQVNGKRRDEITVPADVDDDACKAAALASPTVQKFMEGKPAKKVIVVKGRLVNIVV